VWNEEVEVSLRKDVTMKPLARRNRARSISFLKLQHSVMCYEFYKHPARRKYYQNCHDTVCGL